MKIKFVGQTIQIKRLAIRAANRFFFYFRYCHQTFVTLQHTFQESQKTDDLDTEELQAIP